MVVLLLLRLRRSKDGGCPGGGERFRFEVDMEMSRMDESGSLNKNCAAAGQRGELRLGLQLLVQW